MPWMKLDGFVFSPELLFMTIRIRIQCRRPTAPPVRGNAQRLGLQPLVPGFASSLAAASSQSSPFFDTRSKLCRRGLPRSTLRHLDLDCFDRGAAEETVVSVRPLSGPQFVRLPAATVPL